MRDDLGALFPIRLRDQHKHMWVLCSSKRLSRNRRSIAVQYARTYDRQFAMWRRRMVLRDASRKHENDNPAVSQQV